MEFPGWLTLLGGTLTGGIGLKLVEWILTTGQRNFDTGTKIRGELREELKYLRDRMDELQVESNTWREQYYKILDENIQVKQELREVRGELETMRVLLNELGVEVGDILFLTRNVVIGEGGKIK